MNWVNNQGHKHCQLNKLITWLIVTSAQIFETSANVIHISPTQAYFHKDDHTWQTIGNYIDRLSHKTFCPGFH